MYSDNQWRHIILQHPAAATAVFRELDKVLNHAARMALTRALKFDDALGKSGATRWNALVSAYNTLLSEQAAGVGTGDDH